VLLRISVSVPVFGAGVFVLNWFFMAVFLVCGSYAAVKQPNAEEDPEEEEEALLSL